jgi:hypothetical protein
MAKTPGRSIRIPDILWKKAQKKAKSQYTNVSSVVVGLLEAWTRGKDTDSK